MRWLSRKLLGLGFSRAVVLFAVPVVCADYMLVRVLLSRGADVLDSGWALGGAIAAVLVPLIGGTLVLRMFFLLESVRLRLAVAATQDDLTGVYNRRHFMDVAEREWARCRRYGDDVAVLLIDADHCKSISGEYGYQAGEAVLVDIARVTSQALRQADLVARFGNEQLIVLLPHTDPLGALDVAERIRERVAGKPLRWDHEELQSTVSIGVASVGPDHASLDVVVHEADEALQAARLAGRNCVRAAPIQPKRSGSTYPVISK